MTTEQSVSQTSGSGLPIDLDNPTVNRRRERRIYYRPHYDKDKKFIGYFPTLPLPADAYHLNYYVNKKGFKLWMPGNEPKTETTTANEVTLVGELKPSKPDSITCPVEGCNKIVKSYLGLARHMAKVHKLK